MMRWPPYEHIFFDCDSTLTTVEGIDVLADTLGKRQRVEELTNAAMNGELDLEEVYAKRLSTLQPTHQQVMDIRRSYKRHVVEDASRVVTALQGLGHKVYIISGGLADPVIEFGIYLGIPRSQIRAVDITYNQLSGQWWEDSATGTNRYLTHSDGALTISNGKAQIVRELLGEQTGRSMLIGDGHSDLLAGQAVDLFVGYGGVVTRQIVKENAPVFINSRSMAPLLALAGGPAALRLLQSWPMHYQSLSTKTRYLIHKGVLTFTNEQLKAKFWGAFLNPQQPAR